MAKALLDGEIMVVVVVAAFLYVELEAGSWCDSVVREGWEGELFMRRPRREKKILM
jgi:hypothetical protein